MTSFRGSPAFKVEVFLGRAPIPPSLIAIINGKADKSYVDQQDTALGGRIDDTNTALTAETNRAQGVESVLADQTSSLTGPYYRDDRPQTGGIVAGRNARAGQPLVQDRHGRTALAVRKDGGISVAEMWQSIVRVTRDLQAGIPLLADRKFRTVMSLAKDGAVAIQSLRIGSRRDGRDSARFIWRIGDRRGKRSIAGVTSRGLFYANPSDEFRELLSLPATALRGGYRVVGPVGRLSGRTTAAQVQEGDGTVTFVRQRRDSPLPTAIAETAFATEICPTYGQSNAGWGSVPAILNGAYFPHHVLSFAGVGIYYGTDAIVPGNLHDVKPAQDNGYGGNEYGQTPAYLAANAREALNRAAGRVSPGFFAYTSWYGGQPIAAFQQGTTSYSNLIGLAAAARREIARFGRASEIRCLTFIQGESIGAYGGNTPAEVRSGYATDLTTLIGNVLPALQAATGQGFLPKMLIWQTNVEDLSATSTGVELAQRDVAVARADAVLAGAMYPYPLLVETGDGHNIHLTNIGRMRMAEVSAVAQQSIRDTGDFQPLAIASVTRAGAVLTIAYVPPTGLAALSLSLDSDVVPGLADGKKGFTVRKVSDGSALAISGAPAIAGPWTVQITLSANPGSAVEVRYALDGDTTIDGWAGCRGQLMVQTTTPSIYAGRFGQPVPAFIRHYAIRDSAVSTS